MAYYAFLDKNNIVTEVIPGRDEHEVVEGISDWETYYGEVCGQVCKRTSYNTYNGVHRNGGIPYRFNYAGIGFTFDPTKGTDGAFIPSKPYATWVLNETECVWNPPVSFPTDGKDYRWNDVSVSWDEVSV